jgi:mannose-6-phosphate isomerase-like protein (cupin superfamily)
MKAIMLGAVFLSVLCIRAGAQAPAGTYKTEAELVAALKAGANSPDMLTAAVSNDDQHRINLVRRTKAAGAIAHAGFAELHHIVDGSGTLVVGGTIVRPSGGGGPATIEGGTSRAVSKGDVILVPPGAPHWYKEIGGTGTVTYLEVRWAEK